MAGKGSRWKEAHPTKNLFSFRKRFKSFNFRPVTVRYPWSNRLRFSYFGCIPGMNTATTHTPGLLLVQLWGWTINTAWNGADLSQERNAPMRAVAPIAYFGVSPIGCRAAMRGALSIGTLTSRYEETGMFPHFAGR